jgi:hypothetical protein
MQRHQLVRPRYPPATSSSGGSAFGLDLLQRLAGGARHEEEADHAADRQEQREETTD